MNNNLLSIATAATLSIMVLSGCGELRPLWKGDVKLDNYEMYYSEPCEFKVNLNQMQEEVDAMLEFVITYYVGITRNNLPVFIVLEDQDHNISEYTTNVVLKDQGEWLGIPEKNEIDYSLTHIAIPEIKLAPGEYTLKLYANDDKSEKVYGIVKISARFFEREIEPNP